MAEHSWKPDPNGPRIVGRLVTTADYGVADDIVTRLRGFLMVETDAEQQDIIDEAADEIERLRSENARLSLDLMTALGELMEARRD